MKKWHFYTTNELKPKGWLHRQLEIQAEGLSGNLDKVWRDIRDSKWIGGDAEGWERVPYWLDGFIPLAYLLENEDMIGRAKKYIDAILAAQQADGWICPCSEAERPTYDTWAVQLISKTLTVYYQCSKDERIPTVLYRLLKNYYDLLASGKISLFEWGKFRWYECLIAINFLFERTGETWLQALARLLKEQGANPMEYAHLWKTPQRKWTFETHIVNAGMLLKYEAVSHDILGEEYEDKAEYLHSIMNAYNGTPVGIFTGDECFAGLSPIHGTELCAVVEQMYSFEQLFSYTGSPKWLERLEVLAFNALPATFSDDMWAHQYDQLSNQINCIQFPVYPIFTSNSTEAHLFGLEPNYGCCTANLSQGFPKFALSAFAYNGDTVYNTLPIPSKLTAENCEVEIVTDYPFKNSFLYKVKAKKDCKLKIRIPSFAKNLKVDGEESCLKELTFSFVKGEQREISVCFEAETELAARPNNMHSVKRGSLVFALPIAYDKVKYEYERNGVERKFPYCDYEYVGKTDWNYALSDLRFAFEERDIDEYPFSSEKPAVVVKVKMKKIAWGKEPFYDTLCREVPSSTEVLGEEEEKELFPYGNAKLRITELPLI